ncbi:hypothetical protein ACX27_14085 [Nostoc piscinale CENA21]|uniref:Uncharacterized protein n=1 Tax=Nostoc piscinale CENA21 TaxID=224013 RepID=A0A0M4SRV5_9NOSO|nr:hypothetical protein [Nostoc piscinale]ALF53715.1 hypothetical protein ACX27_14085 [Nostoc piscinale CENA21]
MSDLFNPGLGLAQNQLSAFSSLNNFWNLFDSAFGKEYNRSITKNRRSQWQSGDFFQLRQIEVIDSKVLGNINGAYASAVETSDPDVLNFNITFNDPSGKFSAYYSAIKSHILAAGASWDKYITGNADLEIIVNFSNPEPTATGRSLTSSFVHKNGTLSVYEPGAISEIRTGVDPNGATPDIEFNFNPDYLVKELWFDPDPVTRTTSVPINKTDAVSLLLHEFGHVFGFNAWKDNFDGTLSGNYQSTFDEKVVFDGSNFFFVGKQATSVYGSPVPLTFGNITHVGNDGSRPGVNLIRDLMNGVKFYRGFRYNISSLNVAILKDVGVPIIDVPIVGLSSANQTIFEGTGVDNQLSGGDHNDNLNGRDGNGTLVGGNDIVVSGVGSDRLTGGTGSKKFVFSSQGEGIDPITDFNSVDDFLAVQTLLTHLNYTGIDPIADGYIRGIQSESSTLIQFDIDGLNGNSIFSTLATISNFIASNFSLNNLIF